MYFSDTFPVFCHLHAVFMVIETLWDVRDNYVFGMDYLFYSAIIY